ncbi:hypothetical protein SK128_012504 [Halocaridina rubra]|uniref:Trimethyllysine dioxygenase, mitochondrial n=1 Tax=Halocaridina rubra TaxID=373956 RepID=A0AAN9FTX8_HALRR
MIRRQSLSVLTSFVGRRKPFLFPACYRLIKNRLFCAPAPKPLVAEAIDAVTRLELRVNRWPHTLGLSYIWLRDHCKCPDCYDNFTKQRKLDIQKVPLNIRPASTKTTKEGLEIKWPDGHKSEYTYKYLWQNTYEGWNASYKNPQRLWKAATFPSPQLTTVPLSDILDPKKDGLKRLISSIIVHGLGFISEVSPDVESTRAAVETISPVRTTFYGTVWSFEDNLERADTAYTNIYLGAHNDTTYFTESSRLQVFHCLKKAPQGGETLLVDGFSVAEEFSARHPEGYAFLSSAAIPSEYIGDGQHMATLDTVLKHNPATGCLQQIRYNIYDRAPLSSIPLEKIHEFYLHMRNIGKIVRNPAYEYWLQLEPGTVLIIDNWRLMHGRNAYSGPRIMGGCYISNDDFTSKARVLGIQIN